MRAVIPLAPGGDRSLTVYLKTTIIRLINRASTQAWNSKAFKALLSIKRSQHIRYDAAVAGKKMSQQEETSSRPMTGEY